ncbi:MAG: general secretion pathway protein GspF [Thiogranum sp.]|nr:general secretion pathway protein GspF [Thiogranum sp.]
MAKRRISLHPDAPLLHRDHSRPVTRRDFLRQGFISGTGMVVGGSLLGLFTNPRLAHALSLDLDNPGGNGLAQQIQCQLSGLGGSKIPFICFDLAGGANIAGSNVLVGRNTPLDTLSTAGYSKLGLPGDMIPGVPETNPTATSNGDHTDTTLGLPFHSDSAFLKGILEKINVVATAPNINGAVIPARSENDTGNNPHNPMYGIAKAGINSNGQPEGATGSVVTLIGSRNSDSGGNSMAPAMMIDPEIRPTKVDRASDVTGMVETGNLTAVLNDEDDVTAVMESMVRLSNNKLDRIDTRLANDVDIKNLVRCGYLKAADIAEKFANVSIDPAEDGNIIDGVDPNESRPGIFTQAEYDGDSEFRKTAAVMKMVIDGYAGAGTIAIGGYDYHTGDRETGERRDLRAGRCMGACLEYAARRGKPLMLYVFSDGSVASNGTIDNSVDGRGKGVWTGDNSSTAASFFLVYNPNGPVTPIRQQIGYFRSDGSVETASSPAANNVNLLVETVILNYMALNGDIGLFPGIFTGFGNNPSPAFLDSLTAFGPLV